MKKILALSGAAVIGLSGCATILNDDTQQVNISSSNAKEIKGTVDGRPFTGPGVVTLTRKKENKIVNVETPGCQKSTVVESNVDPKFFINILSGGAFGSTTDYATEEMWRYSDNIVISCKD